MLKRISIVFAVVGAALLLQRELPAIKRELRILRM